MEENMNINVNEEQEHHEANQNEQETFSRSDIDRLISLAYEKAEKKLAKKYEKELNKQKTLVGLDEEAREKALKDQRIGELEEELNKYRLANTKNEISKVLSNRGLDVELVDYVVTSDDTEECLEKIENLDRIINKMIKSAVDERLKAGASVPKNSIGFSGAITKEQFRKMSLSEQAALAQNNRQLYEELSKR